MNRPRFAMSFALLFATSLVAQPPSTSDELLRPFWLGEYIEGEPALFHRDGESAPARAKFLFPIRKVVAVRNSAGDVVYKEGTDYRWTPGSNEISLPPGSRIPSAAPVDLRRPPKSQRFSLNHRAGGAEILFGARLEYAALQTCVTYERAPGDWPNAPKRDPAALSRTVARLKSREPVSIVVLGDSISTGDNASGKFNSPPRQPGYAELLRRHLAARFGGAVRMTNLSVGGVDSRWGLAQVEKVVALRPDLVILAFGMNDASGRAPAEYAGNIKAAIEKTRARLPDCEFILTATMLANPDWTGLKHKLFPSYRDRLRELSGPGIALADLTAIWTEFHRRKPDRDFTGNGVNHPNDFGHRVYAQVLAATLDPAFHP
jgi:lysophospholipase L1-like esterase